MPAFSQAGYIAAISSEEVLSTSATFCVGVMSEMRSRVSLVRSGLAEEAIRFDFQDFISVMGSLGEKSVCLEDVMEMRENKVFKLLGRLRSCVMNSVPIRPTPITAT